MSEDDANQRTLRFSLVAALALTAASLVLGYVGYRRLDLNPLDAFFGTLQLFALDADRDLSTDSVAIGVARFTAPLALVMASVVAVTALVGQTLRHSSRLRKVKDHVVVLEGGQSEARGLAVIAETRRLFPAKRIKYVVNTHPHFDHAAGLPPFVAEGVTILEHDNSRYFLEAAFSEPRTLVGDVLAKSRKKPKVEGVIDKLVLQDETRTLELHAVKNLEHSDAMLMAFLPKEKILFTADFNIPAPGQPVSPSIPALVANLERLGLDFDRFVTVHPPTPDRPLTRADLLALMKEAR